MAKKGLRISEDLILPVDAATATTLVLGGKGMGKSNLLAVVAEEMTANGIRWCAVDPMGVLWGLRYSKDGKGKGIECLILGGIHGDIPIEPTGGAVVADLVVDHRVNVIIDISRRPNGTMWSIGERVRFMLDYGRQLYMRQGSLDAKGGRKPALCQMIDEIARFIPQVIRSNNPQLAECAGMWATICEEGRNVGLGMFMVTQRSARISKDVAELADVMLAFRTVGPNSVGAVMDWLGEHVDRSRVNALIAELRKLPVGSALAVSPGWLDFEGVVRLRERQTYDSSKTPKAGEQSRKVQGPGAKPDLVKFQALMQETIERAKNESVPDLQKKIRELEAKLAKPAVAAKAVPVPGPSKTVEIRVPTPDPATVKANGALRREVQEIRAGLTNLVTDMTAIVSRILTKSDGRIEAGKLLEAPKPAVATSAPQPAPERRAAPPKPAPSSADGEGVALKKGAVEMLQAVASMHPHGLTTSQVSVRIGMKKSGGTFRSYKSVLNVAGLIRTEGDVWYATEEGLHRLGSTVGAPPSTTEEVLEVWNPKLKAGARQMLSVLVSAKGKSMSYAELAEALNMQPSGGTFRSYMSTLNTIQLIVTEGGTVRANAETLFL